MQLAARRSDLVREVSLWTPKRHCRRSLSYGRAYGVDSRDYSPAVDAEPHDCAGALIDVSTYRAAWGQTVASAMWSGQ